MTAATANLCRWRSQALATLGTGLVCRSRDAVTSREACGCIHTDRPGPQSTSSPCSTHEGRR